MFVTLISDFEVFAKKAASLGRVKTWQTVTTVLVEQEGVHVWWPALLIVHELEFESAETGKTRWTFRETVKADAENRVYTPHAHRPAPPRAWRGYETATLDPHHQRLSGHR